MSDGDQTATETIAVEDLEQFYQRLTEWAADQTVDTVAVTEAVIAAMDQRDAETEQARLMAGGELAPVVVEEMIPVLVEDLAAVKAIVEVIRDFFQEDDHDVLTDIRDTLEDLQESVEQQPEFDPHLVLTTNFVDYTVTEGLLLLILLFLIIKWLVQMLGRAFSWLAW